MLFGPEFSNDDVVDHEILKSLFFHCCFAAIFPNDDVCVDTSSVQALWCVRQVGELACIFGRDLLLGRCWVGCACRSTSFVYYKTFVGAAEPY